MQTDMVDVLIATIGRASLEQAILAGLHQTYRHCRVVVVADGHCPRAREIFSRVVGGISTQAADAIYIETPTHHGAGNPVKETWINCPRAAPFIKSLDDDDWLPPRSVEIYMRSMAEDVVLVTGMMCTLTVRGNSAPRYRLSSGALAPDHIGCGSALFRTEAAVGVPLQHVKSGDFLFLKTVAEKGRVVHLRLPLYWYNGYRCDAQRGYK